MSVIHLMMLTILSLLTTAIVVNAECAWVLWWEEATESTTYPKIEMSPGNPKGRSKPLVKHYGTS